MRTGCIVKPATLVLVQVGGQLWPAGLTGGRLVGAHQRGQMVLQGQGVYEEPTSLNVAPSSLLPREFHTRIRRPLLTEPGLPVLPGALPT